MMMVMVLPRLFTTEVGLDLGGCEAFQFQFLGLFSPKTKKMRKFSPTREAFRPV
jgi:hypothetical protein